MSKLLQRSFAPTRGVAWSDRIASKRGLRVIWGSATEPATRLSEKRRLPVPTALLLDTVLDVNRYHEFLPFCAGSRVMTAPARSGTHGPGFDAELVIGFKAFNSAYTSRVSWHQEGPVWRVVAKSIDSRLFDTMDSYWVRKRRMDNVFIRVYV
jgi:ribosome-associated toxin RatA of RatAB toxin-antitoxin module